MEKSPKMIHLFPEAWIKQWTLDSKEKLFKKGEYITIPGRESDHVYLIMEGNARIFHLHLDGKECVLGLISPGDFLNWLDVFTEQEGDTFSKALTDVIAVAIPKSEMKQVVAEHPDLAMQLLRHVALRLKETMEILEQVAYGKVEERLLFLFKKLANPLVGKEGWYPLPDFLTHKDIAGMIASTRETVTFILSKLQQDGVVLQKENRIWIRL